MQYPKETFSEFFPPFRTDKTLEIWHSRIWKSLKKVKVKYQVKRNQKLLYVMEAKQSLLYTTMLKFYINHGLEINGTH